MPIPSGESLHPRPKEHKKFFPRLVIARLKFAKQYANFFVFGLFYL
jgi:hypothetical protein